MSLLWPNGLSRAPTCPRLTYVGFHLLRIHRIDEARLGKNGAMGKDRCPQADPQFPQVNLVSGSDFCGDLLVTFEHLKTSLQVELLVSQSLAIIMMLCFVRAARPSKQTRKTGQRNATQRQVVTDPGAV